MSTTLDEVEDLFQLQQQLEKRGTFQKALQSLCKVAGLAYVQTDAKKREQLYTSATRAFTLTKTRYSNPNYWREVRDFMRVCKPFCDTPSQTSKLEQCIQEANKYLLSQAEADGERPSGDDENDFFSMAVDRSAHFDDAGPIVDDSERWRRAQISGSESVSAGGLSVESGSASPSAAAAPASGGTPGSELSRASEAVFSGMEAIARGTEAIERELESVLSILNTRAGAGGSGGPKKPPPASKKLVASLPRVSVDAAKLAELGEGAQCAVCTDDLKEGDEIQILPCAHVYHVTCVAPWLSTHNSCPVCRRELPTDDPHYEAHKEQVADEEREREGAANTLPHNEFMYI